MNAGRECSFSGYFSEGRLQYRQSLATDYSQPSIGVNFYAHGSPKIDLLIDEKKGYISSKSAGGVFEKGLEAKALMPFVNISAPVTIGETIHRLARHGSPQGLQRINILHLIAYGVPERQKSRVFGIAHRTAFGGSIS